MAINPNEYTISYSQLLRSTTIRDRVNMAQSDNTFYSQLAQALTPTQMANLFPRYYRDKLPDISGFNLATEQIAAGTFGKGLPTSVATGEASEVVTSRPTKTPEEIKDAASTTGKVNEERLRASLPEKAKNAFDEVVRKKKSRAFSSTHDPFSKLTDEELKSIGIKRLPRAIHPQSEPGNVYVKDTLSIVAAKQKVLSQYKTESKVTGFKFNDAPATFNDNDLTGNYYRTHGAGMGNKEDNNKIQTEIANYIAKKGKEAGYTDAAIKGMVANANYESMIGLLPYGDHGGSGGVFHLHVRGAAREAGVDPKKYHVNKSNVKDVDEYIASMKDSIDESFDLFKNNKNYAKLNEKLKTVTDFQEATTVFVTDFEKPSEKVISHETNAIRRAEAARKLGIDTAVLEESISKEDMPKFIRTLETMDEATLEKFKGVIETGPGGLGAGINIVDLAEGLQTPEDMNKSEAELARIYEEKGLLRDNSKVTAETAEKVVISSTSSLGFASGEEETYLGGISRISEIPTSGGTVGSREFGKVYTDPKTGKQYSIRGGAGHAGTDFGAEQGFKTGTPWKAHMGGSVIGGGYSVGKSGRGYGYYIDVKFDDGSIHRYAHNDENVAKGKFEKGKTLFKVGATGVQSGWAHAHAEVWLPKKINGKQYTADELYKMSAAAGGSKTERGLLYRSNPRDYWQGYEQQQLALREKYTALQERVENDPKVLDSISNEELILLAEKGQELYPQLSEAAKNKVSGINIEKTTSEEVSVPELSIGDTGEDAAEDKSTETAYPYADKSFFELRKMFSDVVSRGINLEDGSEESYANQRESGAIQYAMSRITTEALEKELEKLNENATGEDMPTILDLETELYYRKKEEEEARREELGIGSDVTGEGLVLSGQDPEKYGDSVKEDRSRALGENNETSSQGKLFEDRVPQDWKYTFEPGVDNKRATVGINDPANNKTELIKVGLAEGGIINAKDNLKVVREDGSPTGIRVASDETAVIIPPDERRKARDIVSLDGTDQRTGLDSMDEEVSKTNPIEAPLNQAKMSSGAYQNSNQSTIPSSLGAIDYSPSALRAFARDKYVDNHGFHSAPRTIYAQK